MIDEPLQITIFHTNDMHGRLEAIPKLSHFARRLRAEAKAEGRQVFFWDAGDAADRRVRLCSITKGAAFSPILNAMGYSLQTMGNAISLPYGPQAMKAVAERADFPILAANCRDGRGPLVEGLREQLTIPLGQGLAMGVTGFTAPWGGIYEVFGLHLPDTYELAREIVENLRASGISLVVVLSHLGLDDDRRLADEVPGIDLIIGAHSHHLLPEGEERNGVLIAQAGDFACALGRVDLALDPGSGRLLSRTATVLEVPAGEPADPAVLAAIATAEEEVARLMARPIGQLAAELDLDHFGECGIGNFTADVLRQRMKADLAMIASGQFHKALPAGTITFGQLDEACFSSANPCLSLVSGEQILAALERGLDPAISEFEHGGYRGTPVGIPQISGMTVTHDPEATPGQRIRQVLVGDAPIDPEGQYRLAHTDAETIRDAGYLKLEKEQTIEDDAPTIVREAMEEIIHAHSPVPLPASGRWRKVSSTS